MPQILEGKPKTLKLEDNTVLPLLRKDIQIRQGPDDPDGPTYIMYDPIKGQYFQISWAENTIFKLLKPGMTLAQLKKSLNRITTIDVSLKDLKTFFYDAAANELLELKYTSESILKQTKEDKTSAFSWVLSHYLYFRVPIVDPDRFLSRTLKYVKPLLSWQAFIIYSILTIAGLVTIFTRFDDYIHTFTYFFNPQGILFYCLAIIGVKIIHELSHAFVAKKYNVHINAMGVAVIVMWPVLYTDVTDGWKLSKRIQRLAISFAGIAAELVIAGISTLIWAFTEPGILQSVCFLISSVSWITTLFVNLNPMMRYDGYYLLSDLWGIDNLQTRAFTFLRWQIYKTFLGIDTAMPENVEPSRRRGMVFYAACTLIYRFGLYIGVTVFVYYQFTKVLGIILALVEIGTFIIWPIIYEFQLLYQYRKIITFNPRLVITSTSLALALAWFVVPFPHIQSFSAITIPIESQTIYVPSDGVISRIFVGKGDVVIKDQPLIALTSKEIETNLIALNAQKQSKEHDLVNSQLNENLRTYYLRNSLEVREIESQIKAAQDMSNDLLIRAQISGRIYEWREGLHVGQAVTNDQILGKISDLNGIHIVAFAPENEVKSLKMGDRVTFQLKNHFVKYPGTIIKINPSSELFLQYPQLASVHHGDLPTTQEPGSTQLHLVESYYPFIVQLDEDNSKFQFGQFGYVQYRGTSYSKLMELVRWTLEFFWHERGL